MTKISFTKMHGLGNDFIIIDGIHQRFNMNPTLIRRLAHRHTGVGFDQLLLIEPPSTSSVDFNYRIFNADGNEVTQCGNGARCLARFIHEKKLSDKNHFRVATKAGILELKLQTDGQVSVNMGMPVWNPTKIPFRATKQSPYYQLTTSEGVVNFGAVALGNPHCVIKTENCEKAPVDSLGQLLTRHADFPEGVNVGFMQIVDRTHIRLRVYERGVGETLACGSGACAAVVIGQLWDLLDHAVTVDLPGGQLHIACLSLNDSVWMTGPAVTVFEGTVEV